MSLQVSFPRSTPRHFSIATHVMIALSLGALGTLAQAQRSSPLDPARNSPYAHIDFAEVYTNLAAWEEAERHNRQMQDVQELVSSGGVSILDLQAPAKAIKQYNRGASLLKAQNSKEAIQYLEKAIQIYPQFISAHIALGHAYFDQQDRRALDEFKTAATLDSQFAVPFFDLGVVEMSSHDNASAKAHLQRAVDLKPTDTKFLTALAYAELTSKDYAQSLRTAQRVHQAGDQGIADAHFIAAGAAINLQDLETGRNELTTFISEDPTNPLAPLARKHLEWIEHLAQIPKKSDFVSSGQIAMIETFPNSEHLHNELGAANDTTDLRRGSSTEPVLLASNLFSANAPVYNLAPRIDNHLFTIRRSVDETALFLSVSKKGHVVNDLSAADIQILDNDRPPEAILQFTPQSQLPLRLGLLIDTSASVDHRFLFEKIAAQKFIQSVLNPGSDLAFVAGFDVSASVTQDFSADPGELAKGVANLAGGGDGTSVFDAVDFACRKLGSYPDDGHVARVLVILTDGQDNASHSTLTYAIEAAEDYGVTVYTVNTSDDLDLQTDAARVLRAFADRSGGEFLFPKSINELERQLEQLPSLIRSRYLIAYRPANFLPNGKFRTLRVSASKNGQGLKVHVRKGYYARLADTR